MPSRVVGTRTRRTPRSHVAATNPARSVVAPPPRPTIASERVNPAFPRIDQQRSATATLLAASASGTSMRTASRPASVSRCASRSAILIIVGGCSRATRCTPKPSKTGTSATSPLPTSTSYGRSAVTAIRTGSALDDMRVHDHLNDLGSHLAVELGSVIEQLPQLATDVAEEQRSSGIEADPFHALGQTYLEPDHSMTT